MMRLQTAIYAIIMVAALAMGCTRGGIEGRPTLCVSIEPQRKMLEELVGDDYEVVTMLKAGADPEIFEPSIAQRTALSDADAFFTVGTLPFEQKLAASESGATIIDTSEGIATINGTHGDESEADPHIWTSPRNCKTMAANMLAALQQINPGKAAAYASRYGSMAARLDKLDVSIACSLDSAGVKAFAIWHPSLTYYARDYGLHQISAHSESKEMSPAELTAMIGAARADSVRVFFYEQGQGSRQAAVVSTEIGTRLTGINTLAYDWEKQLTDITHELTR